MDANENSHNIAQSSLQEQTNPLPSQWYNIPGIQSGSDELIGHPDEPDLLVRDVETVRTKREQ